MNYICEEEITFVNYICEEEITFVNYNREVAECIGIITIV